MMVVIPNGYQTTPETFPSAEAAAKMMEYNYSLQKAGVLLALDALYPLSMGARVTFTGGKPTVTDGPFSEAKDVIGGFWILQVRSQEEAIEIARRAPMIDDGIIEVRQIFEMADSSEDGQKSAEGSNDLLAAASAKA